MKAAVIRISIITVVFGAGSLVYAGEGCPSCTRGEKGDHRPRREEVLKRFDKDGDGELNKWERKEMEKAMERRREHQGDRGPEGRRGEHPTREEMKKRFDKDGDSKLNKEERRALKKTVQKRHEKHGERDKDRHQQMVERFDKNGDGKLDEKERDAAHKAIKKHADQRGKHQE